MMKTIKKLYYSIGEVSDQLGEEPHVLRYWETEFSQLTPKKNRAGNRVYTDRDLETLLDIQRLLRDDKYTIEGARQVMASDEARKTAGPEDIRKLIELRAFLENLLQKL